MPSIHHDGVATIATTNKHPQQKIRVIPYHQKYLSQTIERNPTVNILGKLSPGEVPRHVLRGLHQKDDIKGGTIWKWEAGEIDTKSKAGSKDVTSVNNTLDQDHSSASSTQRDGIDVINISRHGSSQPNTKQDDSEQDASLSSAEASNNILLVQPTSSASLLRVTEVEPSGEVPPAETKKVTSSSMAKEASTDVVIDLESSESTNDFFSNLDSNEKPLTVTIPTGNLSSHLEENSGSICEHMDKSYSSDFDVSSISIPGFS